MKITKVSIKNYRSCVDTVFSPHESLSAFIGPNGSGKTNILSAIKLLPALCRHRGSMFNDEELLSSPSELKTWFEVDGKTIVHTAKLVLVTNEKNQDEIISSREDWYLFDLTGSRKKVSIPSWVLFAASNENSQTTSQSSASSTRAMHFLRYVKARGQLDSKTISALLSVIKFVSGIGYYSASQFTNPGSAPISFEVEGEGDSSRRTGISITGHKRFLYDLYQQSRLGEQNYHEFLDIIGNNGIGLVESIQFNEITTSSSSYSVLTGGKVEKKEKTNLLVIPSFQISGDSLSPSQLSEGTFKTLALIFYLVTDKSPLLMIEEPEVCVHHGLLKSIMELITLYSNEKQIFISTHSDAILDKLEIENVFKVQRVPTRGTTAKAIKGALKATELTALREYLLNEGSLGEYWKNGDLENV